MKKSFLIPIIMGITAAILIAIGSNRDLNLRFYKITDSSRPTIDMIADAVAKKDYDKAEALIDRVEILYPKDSFTHYVASQIYSLDKKPTHAEQELEVAKKLSPGLKYVAPQILTNLENTIKKEKEVRVHKLKETLIAIPFLIVILLIFKFIINVYKADKQLKEKYYIEK